MSSVSLYPEFPFDLVLASSSPRRHELMQLLGLPFRVAKPDIVEQQQPEEDPLIYVRRNCREKAQALLPVEIAAVPPKPLLILSADTIVQIDGQVLEKPASAADARRMLQQLSGREHKVTTAFCLASPGTGQAEAWFEVSQVTTQVLFRDINQAEIEFYLASGEPYDKAGGYGIQGTGGLWVRSIQGSYPNVVGLPIAEVWERVRAKADAQRQLAGRA
jgi:septum formation protein